MCIIIYFSVPAPISVILTPTYIFDGSSHNLVCTVELSPLLDVPVTVNTVWTGPAGFMTTNTAQPVMGSTTAYISTANISSFGRDQSGNYTCKATVEIMSSFFAESMGYASSKITAGKIMIILYEGSSLSFLKVM